MLANKYLPVVAYIRKHVQIRPICRHFLVSRRMSSAKSRPTVANPKFQQQPSKDKIRNIGIMAHIDAGKTTTTERMLFYSGFTRHLGDVDDGDTVMDYMEQERNRGITIVSAAITFNWNKYKINLIDTPGHVDFTYEVERALRVLDGAVTIIDASAGVEAQTVTVWRQADKFNIPRIAYHNKMDKLGANFKASVNSMKEKLGASPLIIQLPIGKEKAFSGVVDLITMEKVLWDASDMFGSKYNKQKLSQSEDPDLFDEAVKYRELLLEQLADIDDNLADSFIESADVFDIPVPVINHALRKATIARKGIPTLCGSSSKNKGVQPLLDAIVNYLPNPEEIHYDFIKYYKDNLCALAFKIVHDKQRGPLTFIRVYSGLIKSGENIYNANQRCAEKPNRILQIYADDHKEIASATGGNIVALSGLRMTKTGDTLVSSASASKRAAEEKLEMNKLQAVLDDEEFDDSQAEDDAVLAGVAPPDPVFFCSVEPPSLSQQKQLETALNNLEREDPSLRVRFDEETGQTVLEGMGELHLEIIKDRILKEYGVDVYLGPLQIAYRETIIKPGFTTYTLQQTIGKKQHEITINLSVHPAPGTGMQQRIIFKPTEENPDLENRTNRYQKKALNLGMQSALTRGSIIKSQVVDAEVRLHEFITTPRTLNTMITACASTCVQLALRDATSILMEPMMNLEIQTDETMLGSVLADLSNRRSDILEIKADGPVRAVEAQTPLSGLVGYATKLRTMTSGTATFSMELAQYKVMSSAEQEKTIDRITHFRTF